MDKLHRKMSKKIESLHYNNFRIGVNTHLSVCISVLSTLHTDEKE